MKVNLDLSTFAQGVFAAAGAVGQLSNQYEQQKTNLDKMKEDAWYEATKQAMSKRLYDVQHIEDRGNKSLDISTYNTEFRAAIENDALEIYSNIMPDSPLDLQKDTFTKGITTKVMGAYYDSYMEVSGSQLGKLNAIQTSKSLTSQIQATIASGEGSVDEIMRNAYNKLQGMVERNVFTQEQADSIRKGIETNLTTEAAIQDELMKVTLGEGYDALAYDFKEAKELSKAKDYSELEQQISELNDKSLSDSLPKKAQMKELETEKNIDTTEIDAAYTKDLESINKHYDSIKSTAPSQAGDTVEQGRKQAISDLEAKIKVKKEEHTASINKSNEEVRARNADAEKENAAENKRYTDETGKFYSEYSAQIDAENEAIRKSNQTAKDRRTNILANLGIADETSPQAQEVIKKTRTTKFLADWGRENNVVSESAVSAAIEKERNYIQANNLQISNQLQMQFDDAVLLNKDVKAGANILSSMRATYVKFDAFLGKDDYSIKYRANARMLKELQDSFAGDPVAKSDVYNRMAAQYISRISRDPANVNNIMREARNELELYANSKTYETAGMDIASYQKVESFSEDAGRKMLLSTANDIITKAVVGGKDTDMALRTKLMDAVSARLLADRSGTVWTPEYIVAATNAVMYEYGVSTKANEINVAPFKPNSGIRGSGAQDNAGKIRSVGGSAVQELIDGAGLVKTGDEKVDTGITEVVNILSKNAIQMANDYLRYDSRPPASVSIPDKYWSGIRDFFPNNTLGITVKQGVDSRRVPYVTYLIPEKKGATGFAGLPYNTKEKAYEYTMIMVPEGTGIGFKVNTTYKSASNTYGLESNTTIPIGSKQIGSKQSDDGYPKSK